ncbi:MAG: large conductance mechanosensitive channel protein MscL [Rhizomicrobium sp.]
MFEEFKKFAMRGSVIDLAVGVIIGASFTGIVTTLVRDVLNPLIGLVTGGADFTNYFLVLRGGGPYPTLAAAQKAGAVILGYGAFVTSVINFLIVALTLFLVVRQINRLKAPAPAAPPPPPPPSEEVLLLREIRDLLQRQA